MKNRLEVAKEFLREDGFIAIAIDDFEQAYLKILGDEIFGRNNFIGTIAVENNPGGRDTNTFFATSHEYCHFWTKDSNKANIFSFKLTEEQKALFNMEDSTSKFKLTGFKRGGGYSTPEERPNSYYPIYYNPKEKIFSLEPKKHFVEILPIDSNGKKRVWRKTKPSFIKEVENNNVVTKVIKGKYKIFLKDRLTFDKGRRPKTMWYDSKYSATTSGTMLLRKIIGNNKFPYPKSLYTVLDTLKIMTDKDDIIMDFHAGSGTTGHAVLELNKEDDGNRKFILIEQLEEHIAVCKERIQKVMQKYIEEEKNKELTLINENKTKSLEDLKKENYLYFELAEYNQKFIQQIREAKTIKELLTIYKEMEKNGFLSYQFNDKAFKEKQEEFETLSLDEQKQILMELLDKNMLYLNYEDIEDSKYEVDKETIKFNRKFYDK